QENQRVLLSAACGISFMFNPKNEKLAHEGKTMTNIFLEKNGEPFTAFDTSHLMALIIYLLGIVIFLSFSKKVLNHATIYNTIRWGLFSLLIFSEVSYQTYTA